MATYITHISDGFTRTHAVPFPYISKAHVFVEVNDSPTVEFDWVSASMIQLRPTVPISPGFTVRISRRTPTGANPVTFSDGSVLGEEDLNLIATYAAYLAEESREFTDLAEAAAATAVSMRNQAQALEQTTAQHLSNVLTARNDAFAATDAANAAAEAAREFANSVDPSMFDPKFPTGTAMLFAQSTAPIGWTKSTAHNDKALRVVNGTAGAGGSLGFSAAFASRAISGSVGNTTLTLAQIPSHRHGFIQKAGSQGSATGTARYPLTELTDTQYYTDYQGGSGAHNHSFTGNNLDLQVAYVDVIIATKD